MILGHRSEQKIRKWVATGLRIVVVIPCFNVAKQIEETVQSIPDYIVGIVLVDDASKDETPLIVDRLQNGRVHVLHLPINLGVGGAMLAGFKKSLELNPHIVVKMDGDGQMQPEYLPFLLEPLVIGRADYTKGNRFFSSRHIQAMPFVRKVGNAFLSFLTKLASGYWNVFDPTNGYVAIRRELLDVLPEYKIHPRYFFESSMLITLGIIGAVVKDIPMTAKYGDEKSNLNIVKALFDFPPLLLQGFLRRTWLTKILYSLTVEAILAISGIVLVLSGGIFGIVNIVHYVVVLQAPAPSGTVMTAALPILLGFQMLMNAVVMDIQSVPTNSLTHNLIDDL